MSEEVEHEGLSQETIKQLIMLQPRCINCGGTYNMHIHHRIFRSETVRFDKMLEAFLKIYERCYKRKLKKWGIHDIQNLCRLCDTCHEGYTGNKRGIHNGNVELRKATVESFTDPKTGFSIPYYKNTNLKW